jgi:hypothetical protein
MELEVMEMSGVLGMQQTRWGEEWQFENPFGKQYILDKEITE